MADVKLLQVKTRSLTRNMKDLTSTYKEIETEVARLAKFEADPDNSRVKQQRMVVEEATAMVPDCIVRIERARADLASALAEFSDAPEEIIEEVNRALEGARELLEAAAEREATGSSSVAPAGDAEAAPSD